MSRQQVHAHQVRHVVQQRKGKFTEGDLVELPGGELALVGAVSGGQAELQPLEIDRGALDKSGRHFREFAGKRADRVQIFPPQKLHGAGWKLGALCGVLYEADMAEGKQLFFHPFRKQSRPTLAVLNNGSILATLGGAFRVTERGIVDQ